MSDQTVDARRVKKRELDRRAQRLARERNKTRIAQLEAMVQTLQQTDSNTRTAELMGQMNQVAEERDNLLQILRGLNQQIGSHIKRFATAPSSFDLGVTGPGSLPVGLGETNDTDLEVRQALPFDTSSVGDLIGSWGSEWNLFGDLPLDPTSQENPLITPGPSILHISPPLPSEDNLIKPLPSTPCPCTVSPPSPRGVFNTWRAANKALSRPTKLTRDDIVKEDLTSEDTPVRVMLQGWDSVEREGRMTASWRKLREVDEACFRNCDRVERLACMRIMHQLLTFHGWSTEERHGSLPSWLWVRPSQAIAHSYAIDFFVWPSIRERFIFSQHRYCTNLFWDLFQNNFKILWPYDFRDTYLRNSETGKYQLSPMFETRIRDINAWTMGADFFGEFPELYEDIPAYLGLGPGMLSTRREREGAEEGSLEDCVTVRSLSS